MKKLFTLAAATTLALSAVAQTTEPEMVVTYKDGTVTRHALSKVEDVTFNLPSASAIDVDFAATTPLTIVEGSTVTFADKTPGNPTSLKWDFEGAETTTSTEANPTVKYTTAGRYKVALTATTAEGTGTCVKERMVMVLPASGLAMWFPFEGSLTDMGPKGIGMEEFKAGDYAIDTKAPSRHQGSYSVRLDGEAKASAATGYAVLKINEADGAKLPIGACSKSIVMWIKVEDTNLTRVGLFNIGRPANTIEGSTAQSQEWARLNLTPAAADGVVRYYIHDTYHADNGSAANLNPQGATIVDKAWHCLVLTSEVTDKADGTGKQVVARAYIDGQFRGETAAQNAKEVMSDPIYFGCTQQLNTKKEFQLNAPLRGCLDDLMIYDRALTADEVKALYDIMAE